MPILSIYLRVHQKILSEKNSHGPFIRVTQCHCFLHHSPSFPIQFCHSTLQTKFQHVSMVFCPHTAYSYQDTRPSSFLSILFRGASVPQFGTNPAELESTFSIASIAYRFLYAFQHLSPHNSIKLCTVHDPEASQGPSLGRSHARRSLGPACVAALSCGTERLRPPVSVLQADG